MIRRKFDKAHKIAAVKLLLEEGYSVKEVNRELYIHAHSLYRWVSEYEQYGENAFPGHGSALFDAQYKIRSLEKENQSLHSFYFINNRIVVTSNI